MNFNIFMPAMTLYSDHPVYLDNPKVFYIYDRKMFTLSKEEIDEILKKEDDSLIGVREFFIPLMKKFEKDVPDVHTVISNNINHVSAIAKRFNATAKLDFCVMDLIETSSVKDECSTFLIGYSMNFKLSNCPLKSIKNFIAEIYKMHHYTGSIINLYNHEIVKPLQKLIQKNKTNVHYPLNPYYKYDEEKDNKEGQNIEENLKAILDNKKDVLEDSND